MLENEDGKARTPRTFNEWTNCNWCVLRWILDNEHLDLLELNEINLTRAERLKALTYSVSRGQLRIMIAPIGGGRCQPADLISAILASAFAAIGMPKERLCPDEKMKSSLLQFLLSLYVWNSYS
jgi:hypothetical protein